MRVLLTGSNGFVGKNLSPYLNASQISVTHLTRTELNNGDFEKILDCDAVIHLAGKAHDTSKVLNAEDYYLVNFELTKQLYDAFLNSDAKKFIFVSSVKAVADRVSGRLHEDHQPLAKTHYGKSKYLAEEYIRGKSLPSDKQFFILRPCMIHGPQNQGNLNLLFKFVKTGFPYPLAAFDNERSFLSIENLCFVIRELLSGNTDSGVYNVADDEPLSTNTVIQLLGQATGRQPKLLKIPVSIAKIVAKIGDFLHLPLTSERLEKLTENYVVDNKKIKDAIGKNLPQTAREGMLKTGSSFK